MAGSCGVNWRTGPRNVASSGHRRSSKSATLTEQVVCEVLFHLQHLAKSNPAELTENPQSATLTDERSQLLLHLKLSFFELHQQLGCLFRQLVLDKALDPFFELKEAVADVALDNTAHVLPSLALDINQLNAVGRILHEMKELAEKVAQFEHSLRRSVNSAKLIDDAVVNRVEHSEYRRCLDRSLFRGHLRDVDSLVIGWCRGPLPALAHLWDR